MGIDLGGCILVIDGLFVADADAAWQWIVEHLFAMGWDGRATV